MKARGPLLGNDDALLPEVKGALRNSSNKNLNNLY